MDENTQVTQVYDDYAIRHQAAYSVFVKTYEMENPRPDLATISRDVVSLIIVIALTIVSLASIVVSGSRTVEEFGGGFIGTVAFVMIEGGIMSYGFFIARRNANKERLKNTVKWAMAGLVFTVIVGLGANADAVLKLHGIHIPNEVNVFINLLVALSAPTLAFISSDVLAIELMATEIRRREAMLDHDKKSRKWAKDMNAHWRGVQKNWGAKIEVSKADTRRTDKAPQLSALSGADGQRTDSGHGYGQGYNKRTDARTLVYEHLEAFPEDIRLTVRELAAKTGAGKTTVSDVIKEIKARG